jgi:HEAT repeat protein
MGPDAAEVLIPFLSETDPALQEASVNTLDSMKWVPPKNSAGAAYWIAKKDPKQCVEIGSEAVPVLVEALKNLDVTVEVIETLGEIGDTRAGLPLLELSKIESYSLPVIKAIARWKISGFGILQDGIKSPDGLIRQNVVKILDFMNWVPTKDEIGARYWVEKHRWDKCVDFGFIALNPLFEALRREEKPFRKDIIVTLGIMGQEASIDQLLEILNDPDKDLQQTAIESLSHFKHEKVILAFIGLLVEDTLFPVIIRALIEIGEPARQALINAMRYPDLKLRGRASEVLEKMNWNAENDAEKSAFLIARQEWEDCIALQTPAVDLLIQELSLSQNCVDAARALAKIGDIQAIAPIIQAISGKPLFIQRQLAEALGEIGSAALEPVLMALENGQIELIPAIHVIGAIKDERAAGLLTEYLSNDYPWPVRESAAHALGEIGLPAVDRILDAMRGEGLDPKATGIALGEAGGAARDRLIAALKSKEYDAQILVYALGKIPDEESARAILVMLQSQYGQVIQNTAQDALLEIGEPAIRPLVAAMQQAPKEQTFYSNLLIRFGPMAVDTLITVLNTSYNPFFREAIINLLGEIGEVKAVNPLVDVLKDRTISHKTVNAALDKIWKKQRESRGMRSGS